jgi:hypothetical protein
MRYTNSVMALVLDTELKKRGVHGIDRAACDQIVGIMISRTATVLPMPPIKPLSGAPVRGPVFSRPLIALPLLALVLAAAMIVATTTGLDCARLASAIELADQCRGK